ncbi:hypothetical protein [Bacillus sp. CGMCC 1.16541]|uniref:hypothetical protein n=1 Tax=Bacillus sp. CGMCC 1.16541 TaxID=2185143 RepID=UPI000D72FB10|nr:hypothetical protein [Bacillus sp. CGMCC 1.16541]
MTYQLHNSNKMSGHFHTSLRPLVGKAVKVNRGGPESKSGMLLDLKQDYLALAVNGASHVSYYQLKHVKSVTEDSKVNSGQGNSGAEGSVCLKEKSFVSLLKQLKSNMIQINQGGPEATKAFLIDVTDAYMIVLSLKDGISYFNIDQVKSVTLVNDKLPKLNSEMDYVRTNGFANLFKALMTKWVSLNVGGPEAVEGIVVQTSPHNIMLIKNKEVLRIQLAHIRSVSEGERGSFKMQEAASEQEEAARTNETENSTTENNSSKEENTVENSGSTEENNATDTSDAKEEKSAKEGNNETNQATIAQETVITTRDYRWKG